MLTIYDDLATKLQILPEFLKTLSKGFSHTEYKGIKLKKTEFHTLYEMRYYEGRPMSYYCEKVDLENGSFTYLADKLEKKGLIKRVFVEGDRRKKVLMLTDIGKELTELECKNFDEHIAEKLKRLEKREIDAMFQAIKVLEDVKQRLCE